MRRIALTVLLSLVALCGVLGGVFRGVLAAPPATPPPGPTVEELIGQLSSPDFRQRESAGRQLGERAEEALPALRKALPTAEPEARRRMTVLVQRVEMRVLLHGKRVNAHYVKKPVTEIVADMTKQTGYRIDLQGEPPNPRVTLEFKDTPFWEAFDKLALVSGMFPGTNDSVDGLLLMAQDTYVPYVYHSGPFRAAAQGMNMSKNSNLGVFPRNPMNNNNQNNDQFSFSFSLAVEPRLPILGIGQPSVTAAEDDLGRSLVFPGTENTVVSYYNGGSKTLMQNTQVGLLAPGRDAQKLKLIKGSVPVTLLTDSRPSITIDKPLNNKRKKWSSPNYDLELNSFVEVPGGQPHTYQIDLLVKTASTLVVDDLNWLNTVGQRIEIFDEKGKKYALQSLNENPTPASVQANFQIAPLGEGYTAPAKLVLSHWVVTNHQVPYEFRDLPLP